MFGSLSKLLMLAFLPLLSGFPEPLDTRQDSRHIICRTPPVLKNIQAQFASGVYVGVEHVADEFDSGRFVRVLLFEVHNESECAVFEGSICWADDDCVPFEGVSICS